MTEEGTGAPGTLVLGVGNPLLADDGVGLVLLDRVRDAGPWPDGVTFEDGGTWGLSLLPALEDAEAVLVLDAVRTSAPPGTVRWARDGAIPRLYRRPACAHQVDLAEVLAAATLLGVLPCRMAVVGVEPVDVGTLRVGLSAPVRAAVDAAAAQACRVLRGWCAGGG